MNPTLGGFYFKKPNQSGYKKKGLPQTRPVRVGSAHLPSLLHWNQLAKISFSKLLVLRLAFSLVCTGWQKHSLFRQVFVIYESASQVAKQVWLIYTLNYLIYRNRDQHNFSPCYQFDNSSGFWCRQFIVKFQYSFALLAHPLSFLKLCQILLMEARAYWCRSFWAFFHFAACF